MTVPEMIRWLDEEGARRLKVAKESDDVDKDYAAHCREIAAALTTIANHLRSTRPPEHVQD